MNYNAEKSALTVTVSTTPASNFDRSRDSGLSLDDRVKKENVITTKSKMLSSETFTGSNAYGATREVSSYFVNDFGVNLLNVDQFDNQSSKYSVSKSRTITIPMNPQLAKGLKDNIGTLLVCQVKAGGHPVSFAFRSGMSSEATINKPTELTVNANYINVELQSIWLFDKTSGYVIHKEDIYVPQNTQLLHLRAGKPEARKKDMPFRPICGRMKTAQCRQRTVSMKCRKLNEFILRLRFRN